MTAGNWQIQATKTGFSRSTGFGNVVIAATAPKEISLHLRPLGVIAGTVRDQDGEPVAQARVRAFTRTVFEGLGYWTQVRNVAANDKGEYRLWNFEPGTYMLRADPVYGSTTTVAGESTGGYRVLEAFAGTPLTEVQMVATDSLATVDLAVHLQAAATVEGTLSGVEAGQEVRFEAIRPGDPRPHPKRAQFLPASGRFIVYDLVEGTYTLRAIAGERRAETNVVAGARGVAMQLAEPAASVRVRYHWSGAAPDPPPPARPTPRLGRFELRRSQSFCATALRDRFGVAVQATSEPGEADANNLVIRNVAPGEYDAVVHCFGTAYVTGIRRGNDDLGGAWALRIDSGSGETVIDVEARHRGATLFVTASEGGTPGMDLYVIAAPKAGVAGGPVGGICAERRCGLSGLGPGEYTVYLIEDKSMPEFRMPGVLGGLRGGVNVPVAEGETKMLTMTPEVRR